MERRNDGGTLTSVYESSGVDNSTASVATDAFAKTTSSWNTLQKIVNSTWINEESRTITMAVEEKPANVTDLLQTNILLVAVLIVCFMTLASVFAICACMLRRHCMKRVLAQPTDQYETKLVSKSTSVTGLNLAQEYYSTKVGKKDVFSSTAFAEEKCDKAISCESNSRGDMNLSHAIGIGKINSSSPEIRANSDDDPQVYFKMKNLVTSTPSVKVEEVVDGNQIAKESDELVNQLQKQSIEHSVTYTNDGSGDAEEQPDILFNQDEKFEDSEPRRGMAKGPLTQSVSWFVPLNGIQREPLRHSIIEISPRDADVKDGANGKTDQQKVYSKSNILSKQDDLPLYKLDESGANTSSSSTSSKNAETASFIAENVPLMSARSDKTNSAPNSVLMQRSRLKCSSSEEKDSDNSIDSCERIRSLSLSSTDDNNIWKQREERPVLFLGSGI